jgi:membrane-associated phospholipid phosphatase
MAALTFVATMAFGWHYAVDAIGGIALAWAVCALLWRFLPRRAGEQGVRAEAPRG